MKGDLGDVTKKSSRPFQNLFVAISKWVSVNFTSILERVERSGYTVLYYSLASYYLKADLGGVRRKKPSKPLAERAYKLRPNQVP